MRAKLNPLSYLALFLVLVGLLWLLLVWQPSPASAGIMARPTPPEPDPFFPFKRYLPLVLNQCEPSDDCISIVEPIDIPEGVEK